ncbi:MAG: type IVB secretion system protein IcmW [Gammaproteobacteria bacterium]
MPNLSSTAVHRFWRDYEDPMIYRVITFMEGVESWAVDGDAAVEDAMSALSEELDNIGMLDMSDLGQEDVIIRIASHLGMGRALRLLHAIDSVHPGAASKLLIHAEGSSEQSDDVPGLFLRRNIVFERLRLLARVFSTERFTLILKVLEGE